jgi:isopentenyl diphosphate isomerase/L-lactate dehydrogenase-like FMN-dependent dehydrogenase
LSGPEKDNNVILFVSFQRAFETRRSAHNTDPTLSPSLALLDRSSNFARDLPWLGSLTSLPIMIKGILSPEDAVAAAEAGM